MTRRKALTFMLSMAGLSGLIFALLLLTSPDPALSSASYAYKPGCHCGRPATATVKATTTTVRKTTATTAKKATATTAKKTTTTAAKKVTTTATSGTRAAATTTAKASLKSPTTTKSSTRAAATRSTQPSTSKTQNSTTTTSAESNDPNEHRTLTLGAAVASFPGGGDGGSSGGTGGPGGSLDAAGLSGGEPVAAESLGPPHYYLSPVAIAFLLIYGVSFALYRTKRLRVATHRKIWNVLLMATFLLCGILGLVLAVGVTRSQPWQPPTWLLVWHVETGIAMCFISFFHIGWHLRYYLAIITGKRRAERPAKAPLAERGPRGARVRAPLAVRPVAARTEVERQLAFEQRQAGRSGHSGNARGGPASSDAERWLEERRRRVAPAS
jgi:hypothetical protein